MMWPRTGNPRSPITGFRPLPGGGVASSRCFQSTFNSRFSSRPMPGMVFTVGVNRRLAWSSR